MTEVTCALEATRVSRHYRGKLALTDCTLSVPSGRVAAIVGPNGAGKSTLLRMAAGLVPPTSGTLKVLGTDAQHLTEGVRRRVGYLDQDRPMYPSFRVRDAIEFGLSDENHGISPESITEIPHLLRAAVGH